jgi:hypothetical protein
MARKKSAEPASRSQAATNAFDTGQRIGEANDQFERDADRAADAIMAGQHYRHQWSFSQLPLGHARLQRQPTNAAAQKRLDTFAIDASDLSNPFITGQLRSLSNSKLGDYKDKVKDTDVKRYVESLMTFSTPTQSGASVDPLTGNMSTTIGNATVVIKPDERGARVKTADTNATFHASPPRIPDYTSKDGVVVDYPTVTTSVTVEIVTSYETGVSPEGTSGYGRGTTTADVANKATSLRFHEGSHGEDYIDFVRKNPYPSFAGRNGMTVREFEKAKTDFNKAVSDWGKAFNKVKLQGDCVGTTIDQFHKGEPGYTNICP